MDPAPRVYLPATQSHLEDVTGELLRRLRRRSLRTETLRSESRRTLIRWFQGRRPGDTLRQSGLSIANMVKHKLYVKQGSDIPAVVAAFHRVATRLAPGLIKNPSAETLIVVEGLARAVV